MCRLDDEIKARKVLEKDVDNLKKTHEDTTLNCKRTQKEIDLVKEELEQLNQDHKNVSDPSEPGLTHHFRLNRAVKPAAPLPGGG